MINGMKFAKGRIVKWQGATGKVVEAYLRKGRHKAFTHIVKLDTGLEVRCFGHELSEA